MMTAILKRICGQNQFISVILDNGTQNFDVYNEQNALSLYKNASDNND